MTNITKLALTLFLTFYISACATSETRSSCRDNTQVKILKLGGQKDHDFYPECSEGTKQCDKEVVEDESRTCHIVKCSTSC